MSRSGEPFTKLGCVPSFCPSREPRNASEEGARGVSTGSRLKPFEERNDEAALRSRRILARSRAENLGHPLLLVGLACASTLACKRTEPTDASQPTRATLPDASVAPTGRALNGFDECLVGKFESENVTLKLDRVNAEGGAKVALQITSDAAAAIDFSPMDRIHAKGDRGLRFDIWYSGTATASLKTPVRGTLVSESTNFDGLRVNAAIILLGAASVPILKNTTVTELARMATAIEKSLPPQNSSAPGATNPLRGIDASPVFSSTHYACQGDTLTLENAEGGATWTFIRTP